VEHRVSVLIDTNEKDPTIEPAQLLVWTAFTTRSAPVMAFGQSLSHRADGGN
jgi:hypothetical protein